MVRIEKVHYKPVPVRSLLLEMKDLSELMIDLAYSAALFHDQKLAEEVLELEEHVDSLAYLLGMNAMLAARDAKDAEALIGVSKVAAATDKISDAAADLAMIVLRDVGIHPIIREAFRRVEERLARVRVKSNSVLAGKKLKELELASRIGVDIIAIKRRGRWIINPNGDDRIEADDVLIARGAPSGVKSLKRLAWGAAQNLEG